MNTAALLDELDKRRIKLFSDGHGLEYQAPVGALTDLLRAEIARQRGALIAEVVLRACAGDENEVARAAQWTAYLAVPAWQLGFQKTAKFAVELRDFHRNRHAILKRFGDRVAELLGLGLSLDQAEGRAFKDTVLFHKHDWIFNRTGNRRSP